MDEARAANRIEVNLPQEKRDFRNNSYQKELQYWKNIVLASKNESEKKQLTDLTLLRVFFFFLAWKAVLNNDAKNVNEIFFYLKNQYLSHNEGPRASIEDIPSQKDRSFQEISDYLKFFSKSIKENENMTLKNKTLMGGWISTAARVFRRDKNILGENFPGQFEDWMYRECGIKKQTIYNYKNLNKLMRLAPKLLNCRVNMTHFVKNHEILFNHFEDSEEQIPWKHNACCDCETCSSYFTIRGDLLLQFYL